MSLRSFLVRLLPRPGNGGFRISSSRFMPIQSERGRFTCFVGNEALSLLEKHANVDHAAIDGLLAPVYEKGRSLGFAHGEPVHFLLDAQDLRNERTTMTVGKIEPPMEVGGKVVTRSVFIFGREFIEDMANVERQTYQAFQLAGVALDGEKKRQVAATIAEAQRTKALMGLSHELVHIFATDEYKSLMPLLGLDLLELLTDSINLDLHYNAYRSSPAIIRGAFIEGFAYLTNFIKAESGLGDSDTHLNRMWKLSREILRECRRRQRSAPASSALTFEADLHG